MKNLNESIADTAVVNRKIESKLKQFDPAQQTKILDALEAVKNAGPGGISPSEWASAVKQLYADEDLDLVDLLKTTVKTFGFVVKRIGEKRYAWSETDAGLDDVDPRTAAAMRMQIQLGQLATATMKELGEFNRDELAAAISNKTGMPMEAASEYADHVMGQFIGGMLQPVGSDRFKVATEEPKTADDHIRDLLRRSGLSENLISDIFRQGLKRAPGLINKLLGKSGKTADALPNGMDPVTRELPSVTAQNATGLSATRNGLPQDGPRIGYITDPADRLLGSSAKMTPSLQKQLMTAAWRATRDTAAAGVIAHDAFEVYNEMQRGDLRDPAFRQQILTSIAQKIQQDGSMLFGLYLGGLLGRGMSAAKGGVAEIPGNILGMLAAGATDIWYGSTADEIVANTVADLYGEKPANESDLPDDYYESMLQFVRRLSEDEPENDIITINSAPEMHPNQDDLKQGLV